MSNIVLYCRACKKQFKGKQQENKYIVSNNLTKHLLSSNGGMCLALYRMEGLMLQSETKGQQFNFSISTCLNNTLLEKSRQMIKKKQNEIQYIQAQLGINSTKETMLRKNQFIDIRKNKKQKICHSDNNDNINMVLDNQVLYNVSKRPICEENLEKLLSLIKKNNKEERNGNDNHNNNNNNEGKNNNNIFHYQIEGKDMEETNNEKKIK